jgi:hypothetical protein
MGLTGDPERLSRPEHTTLEHRLPMKVLPEAFTGGTERMAR